MGSREDRDISKNEKKKELKLDFWGASHSFPAAGFEPLTVRDIRADIVLPPQLYFRSFGLLSSTR